MNDKQVQSSVPNDQGNGIDWGLFGLLMSLSLLAALAVLPYMIEIYRATGKEVVMAELAVSTITEHLMLTGIAICIGMMLGPKVGLGTPLLSQWRSGSVPERARLRSALVAGFIVGVGLTIGLALVDPWLEGLMPEWPESARQAEQVANEMASWKPLLASFSAGVTEELLFRYGLMTLVVWIGVKVARRESPTRSLLWMANLVAALLFSLAHLSNVLGLGIPVTVGVILYLVITNGTAGAMFGWLYCRHGLGAAVFAHFLADVVSKVLAPLFGVG